MTEYDITVSWVSMGHRYSISYACDGVWLRGYSGEKCEFEVGLGVDLAALQQLTNAATALEITIKEMGIE
jgi:hypothetical protein